ncbi:MAG: flagellar FliJ family protein [Phycisphaeraceae bacterium]
MAKKFKFQLQPALDKAESDKEKAEHAVLAARKELAAAEEKLRELQAIVEKTTQQIRTEHDNLTKPTDTPGSGNIYLQREEYIRALKVKLERQKEAVVKQKAEVAWFQQRLDLRMSELKEAAARAQAIDKLRDKAIAEHKKEEDRRLQNEIDEAGMR